MQHQSRLYRSILCLVATAVLTASCTHRPRPAIPDRGLFLVDQGGRTVETVEIGASLRAGATGLSPGVAYDFELRLDGVMVSFARLTADSGGRIAPFHLLFHSGVVGCSLRDETADRSAGLFYRSFDEAAEALEGRSMTIAVSEARVPVSRLSFKPVLAETAEALRDRVPALFERGLPVVNRKSPMVFPSTGSGCLLNSAEANSQAMFVSGRNFTPGETVELHIVPNQREWRVNDVFRDVTGERGAPAPVRVRADANGRFTARVWEREDQRRGAYDIVARRDFALDPDRERPLFERLRATDIISYGSDTAYILFLRYPPGGPLMDIAGRKLIGSPYFEFADSFAETADDVWGAVDPTYVPTGHPGGHYGAYYVVNHKSVLGWAADNNLSDISGGPEIVPVKAGCINGTDVPIWVGTKALGNYDVVVNFGSTPAETAPDYMEDNQYNDTQDFLDGADQIGFRVARDPVTPGSFAVGRTSYDFPDLFSTLGTASDVDLRAEVRYPGVSAGTDVTVAAGTHPLFVILHGNHRVCRISATHATCPLAERVPNHRGYDDLLDILASQGVIAVSIDGYDVTATPSWHIIERGELILKHLEFWSHLNNSTTYPTYSDPFSGRFTGKVDMSRISVSGHSRGGEASVEAFVQNKARPPADQFSITSVSSIAPVDFLNRIHDTVPYFVILAAGDGDVSTLHGVRIYDRAGDTADSTLKSSIYVYGANHNFFNSVWTADYPDNQTFSWPTSCQTGVDADSNSLNENDDYWRLVLGCSLSQNGSSRADYMPPADQIRIGNTYLAAFTRSDLLGQDVYEDMLRGRLTFPSTAGFKIHHTRHENNHNKIESGSGAGSATGLTPTSLSGPSVHVTQALEINWSSAGTYVYTLPAGSRDASSFEVLSFRVAQTFSSANPSGGDQEFKVELTGGGNLRLVYTGRFDRIPPPYVRPDLQQMVMTTVRIPLHSFIMNRSNVDLADVTTVTFRFDSPMTGEIIIDDVEFSR